jgi:hypothetical protein
VRIRQANKHGTVDALTDCPHVDAAMFHSAGVVFGMFQVPERLRFGIGGGVQIAATRFHQYDHR